MIEKLGKQKYLVRVYAGVDAKGKRRSASKVIYGERALADAKELELKQRKNQGQPLSESKLTIEGFYKEWREAVRTRMKEKTLLWFDQQFNKHVCPAFGHVRLTNLEPIEVEKFYAEKIESGLGVHSIESFHAVLSLIYKDALRWKYVRQSPMSLVAIPKLPKREMLCFDPEQARKYIQTTYQVTHGLVLRFALQTGLRPEEYTGLKWPYLDFNYKTRAGQSRGRVVVRETVIPGKPGGGWWWSTPKSESGNREVLFPSPLLQELQQHRIKQCEYKLALGKHYQDHDLVFTTEQGLPLPSKMLSWKTHKKVLGLAGLSHKFRLYDLRHSWVTLSILSGGDLKTISTQAGHASVAFTLDRYGHVLPEMRETTVDKFEALFQSDAQQSHN
jgi:integrase